MKYILGIKHEYEDSFKGLMILGAKDSNLFVDTLAVEDLEELNSDYINDHFGGLQEDAYERGHGIGYQKGFEDGKAVREKGCEGCRYTVIGSDTTICSQCCNAYYNQWTANETNYDIIRNGIQNWVTELNVKAEDIQKILEDMKA